MRGRVPYTILKSDEEDPFRDVQYFRGREDVDAMHNGVHLRTVLQARHWSTFYRAKGAQHEQSNASSIC
jgi:hypothetical protein